MTLIESTLLQALELLAKSRRHVSRDNSIGGQQCSTEITEFLAAQQQTFFELQACALREEHAENSALLQEEV